MKSKRIWISLWLLTLLTIFIVTLVNHSPYFLLGGSSSIAPVMEELLSKYPNNHKKGDFNYVSSASSGASSRVESGLFGIGWLSKEYKTDNPKILTFQIMLDGLIIVYNLPADNLIDPSIPLDFTIQKVRQLYLENKDWKEVFPKEIRGTIPVKTFTRPNGSGTRDIFDNKVLGGISHYRSNTVDSSSSMLTLDPGSIGYSAFADINQAKKISTTAGTWEGHVATFQSIKDQSYKLSRPFTGLINYQYKYNSEMAHFLKWIFKSDSEVESIFQKYGPRVELNDPINSKLNAWLNEWI